MKMVIALGGNALGSTAEEQFKNAQMASDTLAALVKEGHQIVLTHGNGPQVGMVNNALVDMPFPECGAMTQGYIGYHLQNTLRRSLLALSLGTPVVSLVTQVEVSQEDPAFQNPTKPIGLFMTREEAEKQRLKTGYTYMEDAGRGWRRVVPSPLPVKIIEMDAVKTLVDQGFVVVASGGGGIPVVKGADGSYEGVAAVIDKDMSAAKMAEELQADVLLILTAVEAVCLDFNSPRQRTISRMNLQEAEQFVKEGHFAKGSMLPKVQAAIQYVSQTSTDKNHPCCIITSIEKAREALMGTAGTRITDQ